MNAWIKLEQKGQVQGEERDKGNKGKGNKIRNTERDS